MNTLHANFWTWFSLAWATVPQPELAVAYRTAAATTRMYGTRTVPSLDQVRARIERKATRKTEGK